MKFHVIMTAFHHECRLKTFDDESEFRMFLIDEICDEDDEEEDFDQMPLKDLVKLAIDAGNTRHYMRSTHIGAVFYGDILGQGYV